MILQRLRDDIANIVRSHGYEGEVADMLIDAISYYASEHLIHLAGQYYNSSLFKTKNEDAVLQLGLDHSVPVYRGENASVIIKIRPSGPLTFAPLQLVYDNGKHYFYVKSKRYIQLDVNSGDVLIELVYAKEQAAIVDHNITITEQESATIIETEDVNNPLYGKRQFISDFYIISDELPISQDVACYAIYTQAGVNYSVYLPHTEHAHDFYFFNRYLTDRQTAIGVDRALQTILYPILILTTPRYGINIRVNYRYILEALANSVILRTYYLNYTTELPPDDILSALIDYLNQNFPVNPLFTSVVDIVAARPPHTIDAVRYNIAEGARFNGIIRSVSDIRNWFLSFSDVKIYDAKLYTVINTNNQTSSNAQTIDVRYVIYYISDSNIPQSFLDLHKDYIYAALPTMRIIANNVLNGVVNTQSILNWLPSGSSLNTLTGPPCPNNSCFHIVFQPLSPITVVIEAKYVGNPNIQLVREVYAEVIAHYKGKIIERVDPMEWFTLFTKLNHVAACTYFKVYTVGMSNNGPFLQIGGTTYTHNYLVLLDLANTSGYYIRDFDLSAIMPIATA